LFKSFTVIDDFVRDVYGCSILSERLHPDIEASRIVELICAHDTMIAISRAHKKPSSSDFMRDVYPLLEIAVQWRGLKEEGKLTNGFLKQAKERLKHIQNFYGTTFELDMASRCLLSGWPIRFVENSGKGDKQIDFIFYKNEKAVGIECLSKRLTGRYSPENMTLERIQDDIDEHAKKFRPKHITRLGVALDERVIVVEITRSDYRFPDELLVDLGKTTVPGDLDGIVYTWREEIIEGENRSIRARYRPVGGTIQAYFSTTYAAEFRGGTFFIRNYVEHEPTWGAWGPVETMKD
jgi:hypothetical protein